MLFADLSQVRRPNLLSGLDQKLGIEAKPAAARLAHRLERRNIDAVLPLVVGSAPAIDAIAGNRRPPWIEIIAPLSGHAVDDIAVSVDEDGGGRSALAVFGQKIRVPSGRRFDQPRQEIEFREGGLKVFGQVGAQCVPLFWILAFGLIGHPSIELGEKLAGMKHLMSPGNGIGSGHVFFSCRSRYVRNFSRY